MEKKITGIYITVLLLGMLAVVSLVPFLNTVLFDRTERQEAVLWDDRMEESRDGEAYVYRMVLPSEKLDGKMIGYHTAHMQVEVTVGGQLVYFLSIEKGQFTKTSGYNWNFISLTDADAGKEIVYKLTPAYADSKPKPGFYYGTQSAMEHRIIRERAFRFAMSMLILLLGVLLLLFIIVIAKKASNSESLFHFTVFACMLGLWYACESQLLELFLPCQVEIVFADHILLMLMPMPFLLFLRQMYQTRDHILWNIICYLNCGIVMVRIFLQVFRLMDFRETLWMTHVGLGLSIVCVFVLSIYEITHTEMTAQVKLNIACILVIMVTIILELAEYRIRNRSTPLGSMGFLFYIVVMGIVSVKNSRQLMQKARESELYRELAFTDELTGIYNRTAFNRDLNERRIVDEGKSQYNIVPTALFMFDLNDLKKCNDGYGHEFGDRYIIMVSEAIQKVFGLAGSCYRIGGDEFCSSVNFSSEEELKASYQEFAEEIRKRDAQTFVVPVSVAVGYAVYDSGQDKSLEDTMKRADAMMYANKQKIKREQKNALV